MQTVIASAQKTDIPALAWVEGACFPPAERCSTARMAARLRAFPDWFFAARRGEALAGFVHGMGVWAPAMCDEFYFDPTLHAPAAPWQCVLGLAVAPAFRGQGIARRLMGFYAGMAQAKGKKGLVLACKKELRPFYESIGFVESGISQSCYGGAVWWDMVWVF